MNSYLAEYIGTMLLIIMGNGVVASVVLKETKSNNAGWLTICVGWGLAVTFSIYAVGGISGAHLNPAVSLALAIKGDFLWSEVPYYVLAQIAGAFSGSVVVYFHFLPHWIRTTDPQAKLAVFSTSPAIKHTFSNLLSEVIGTTILVLGLLFIGTNKFTDGLNPLVVGALITAIGLSLGGTTGFAINPARDIGPRIAHALLPIPGKGGSGWDYSWIPVIGPIIGASLATGIFSLLN